MTYMYSVTKVWQITLASFRIMSFVLVSVDALRLGLQCLSHVFVDPVLTRINCLGKGHNAVLWWGSNQQPLDHTKTLYHRTTEYLYQIMSKVIGQIMFVEDAYVGKSLLTCVYMLLSSWAKLLIVCPSLYHVLFYTLCEQHMHSGKTV